MDFDVNCAISVEMGDRSFLIFCQILVGNIVGLTGQPDSIPPSGIRIDPEFGFDQNISCGKEIVHDKNSLPDKHGLEERLAFLFITGQKDPAGAFNIDRALRGVIREINPFNAKSRMADSAENNQKGQCY